MDAVGKGMDFLIKHWAPYARRFPAAFRVVSTDFIKRKTERVTYVFNACNFSLILRGGGDFVRNGRVWPVVAPCVITQWPGDELSYGPGGAHENWDECYVIYPAALRRKFEEAGFIDETRPVWPIQNLPAVQEYLRELHALTRSTNPESAADRVDRVWERILLETTLAPEPAADDERVIHRIQAQMKENLAEPLDMDFLARKAGVSLPTLRRRWLAVTGMPPARYLQELRLRAASRMLVETSLPVKRIARETGFEDELYFSRRFRLGTGLSPSEYRESFRLSPLSGR